MASVSNEAVVEQVHSDEVDAQSDSESAASLLSQWAALDPGLWFHPMPELSVKAVEGL